MKGTRIRSVSILVVFVSSVTIVPGQSLRLQECYSMAQGLSPVSQQELYYTSIAELERQNAAKIDAPKIWLSGRASYQSDVFTLPFEVPDVQVPDIPKDQYQLKLELNQRIYDGGRAKIENQLAQAEANVNKQNVAVELNQIKNLINQLFFGALIAQENERILDTVMVALQTQLHEVQSGVKHGVLLASNALVIKKEILAIDQQLSEVRHDKRSLLLMLSQWVATEIPETTRLIIPDFNSVNFNNLTLSRPELGLFDFQVQQLDATRSLLDIRNLPMVSAFAEGGIASPNPYNPFDIDIAGFYIAGIKLQWQLLDWGQKKNDLKILELQREVIASKKRDFGRTVSISMLEEQSDIQKFTEIIEKDWAILELQQQIVNESYSQLKNGLITSTQYIIEVSNLTKARTNIKIHQLNLLKTEADLLVKSGNI